MAQVTGSKRCRDCEHYRIVGRRGESGACALKAYLVEPGKGACVDFKRRKQAR